MMSLQETFDLAKDGSGVPAQHNKTQSNIKKKKTRPTKMRYHSYAPPYHPSLQSSKTSTTITTHAAAQHQLTKKLQPLQLPTLQSNYINAKMNELRNLAVVNANKRQKKVDYQRCGSDVESVITPSYNCNTITTSSDGFDMLEELDGQPNVTQIVATSGGMITHWNESFTKLIKQPSSSSSSCPQDTTSAKNNNLPLTIFEIVDSKSLPSLYSMLAMALHNVSIVDVEDFAFDGESSSVEEVDSNGKRKRTAAKEEDSTTSSSSSHLSITLPCKSFHGTRTRYNITVVFMNDTTSMKRSFLGILTPRRKTSSSQDDDDDSSSSTITSCSSSGVPKVTTSKKDTTTEDDEQDTQDICKALKNEEEEEYDTSRPSCNVRQLPCDKIIRVNDKLLCRMLLGSC